MYLNVPNRFSSYYLLACPNVLSSDGTDEVGRDGGGILV